MSSTTNTEAIDRRLADLQTHLRILFRNKSDCYTEAEIEYPAMTEERFVEVCLPLITDNTEAEKLLRQLTDWALKNMQLPAALPDEIYLPIFTYFARKGLTGKTP